MNKQTKREILANFLKKRGGEVKIFGKIAKKLKMNLFKREYLLRRKSIIVRHKIFYSPAKREE